MHAPSGVCDSFRDMGLAADPAFGVDGTAAHVPSAGARKPIRPRRMIMKVRRT